MFCEWCNKKTNTIKKIKEDIGTDFDYHFICVDCYNNIDLSDFCFVETIKNEGKQWTGKKEKKI